MAEPIVPDRCARLRVVQLSWNGAQELALNAHSPHYFIDPLTVMAELAVDAEDLNYSFCDTWSIL